MVAHPCRRTPVDVQGRRKDFFPGGGPSPSYPLPAPMVSAPAADPGVPSGRWRHVQTPHATSQRLLKLNGRRRKDRLWRLNDDNTVAVETKRRTTSFRCVSRGTRLKHERDIAQRFVEKKQLKVDANREQGVSDRHCYDKSGVPNLGYMYPQWYI